MFSLGSMMRRHWVTVQCPACGFENDVQMGQASLNERVLCSGCHMTIQLVDKDVSTVVTTKAAARAMDDLQEALKRLEGDSWQ
jgi:Zn ribbon nucleic-acid-binding protein